MMGGALGVDRGAWSAEVLSPHLSPPPAALARAPPGGGNSHRRISRLRCVTSHPVTRSYASSAASSWVVPNDVFTYSTTMARELWVICTFPLLHCKAHAAQLGQLVRAAMRRS
eukprot:1348329-Pyramimonas_sp.AAC.1